MTAYLTTRIDRIEVLYRQAGERTAPTPPRLHGFPSSSAQYQALMDRLQHRYHAIAADYPGFGQSAPLDGTTTFDRIADVIEGFTQSQELGLFSLYMFDCGAPVAFRLATGMQALMPY